MIHVKNASIEEKDVIKRCQKCGWHQSLMWTISLDFFTRRQDFHLTCHHARSDLWRGRSAAHLIWHFVQTFLQELFVYEVRPLSNASNMRLTCVSCDVGWRLREKRELVETILIQSIPRHWTELGRNQSYLFHHHTRAYITFTTHVLRVYCFPSYSFMRTIAS